MKGSYCLIVKVSEQTSVQVGSLGTINFRPGRYVYVGSALNGLEKRIGRHISVSRGENRKKHWHIDYLLSSPHACIEGIYYRESCAREECMLSEKVSELGPGVSSFGCSDCGCRSHLYTISDTGWFRENMQEYMGERETAKK